MGERAQVRDIPYEAYRMQQQNEAMEEARRLEMDKTVPGGRYLIGETVVNANGDPVEGDVEEYEDMKVAALRRMAEERGIDVPDNAKKADLVAALEADDTGDFENSENPVIEGTAGENPQVGKTGL
jgi:hypothetical protein